jgi:PAS domain S-box-containing protein
MAQAARLISSGLVARDTPDCAIHLLDPEGQIVFWNEAAERITGYTAVEIIGRHFSCLYSDPDREAGLPEQGLAIAAERGHYATDGWRIRKDGRRFFGRVSIESIKTAGLILGLMRDITAEKSADRRHERDEAQYRAIIETLVDGVAVIDEHGIVESFNPAAERIFGYEAAEVIGRNVSLLMPEPDRSRHDSCIANYRQTGQAKIIGLGREVMGRRKDGSIFPLDLSIAEWRADHRRYFTGIVRDITTRKATERAAELARVALLESQKMEAVGRLTGGIAHDFNNILQVIIGNVMLAEQYVGDNDQLRRYHHSIRRAAQRADQLTQQLLAFARKQPLRPETINLSERMHEFVGLLDRTLRGDIRVEAYLPDNLWRILVDASQLELAILNIAVNARDAMAEGGALKVTAHNATYEGLVLEHDDHALSGSYVVLSFSDTGSGIAQEVLPKVFEPFFTTKEVGKGAGLGLSQVYGFVRQSGGTATVDSVLGEGTTVSLYLPALQAGEQVRATLGRRGVEGAPSNGTILVVEDDPDVAELTIQMLERGGYTVQLVDHAAAALSVLRSKQPIDLVFSDIIMPGGSNGVALAEEIGKLRPELPILLASGYTQAANDAKAKGFTILRKPYWPGELLNAVEIMLQAVAQSRRDSTARRV